MLLRTPLLSLALFPATLARRATPAACVLMGWPDRLGAGRQHQQLGPAGPCTNIGAAWAGGDHTHLPDRPTEAELHGLVPQWAVLAKGPSRAASPRQL